MYFLLEDVDCPGRSDDGKYTCEDGTRKTYKLFVLFAAVICFIILA